MTKKIITEPIKTDLITKVVKPNYIEKRIAREREEELAERKRNARAYIRSCRIKRNQKRKDIFAAITTGVMCAGLVFALVACGKTVTSTPTTSTTETTPKSCKVVETRGNIITVECRGSLYAFYGDGFSEGEFITCYFTSDGKITDAE